MSDLRPRVLALVGMPGAGKSVCTASLSEAHFFTFRFGQIVVDEVAQRGLALSPLHERIVREDLREKEGMNAIVHRALPHLNAALETHNTIVIDGLYGFGEYKILREAFGDTMCVICITCDRDVRYQRLAARAVRPLTPQEAEVRDHREIDNLEKGGPIAIADYTLLNNTDVETLLGELSALLTRLGVTP